jgi:hypothetical protein
MQQWLGPCVMLHALCSIKETSCLVCSAATACCCGCRCVHAPAALTMCFPVPGGLHVQRGINVIWPAGALQGAQLQEGACSKRCARWGSSNS